MKILAQSDNWYVIQTGDNVGRVFDLERRRLFAPMALVAILARGGWHEFSGDETAILQALSVADDLRPEVANQQALRPIVAA
jgi:hypothetical protein